MKTDGCSVCHRSSSLLLSCTVLLYKPDRVFKSGIRRSCESPASTEPIREPHQQKASRRFQICPSCIAKAKETALVDPMLHAFINALMDAFSKLEFKDSRREKLFSPMPEMEKETGETVALDDVSREPRVAGAV